MLCVHVCTCQAKKARAGAVGGKAIWREHHRDGGSRGRSHDGGGQGPGGVGVGLGSFGGESEYKDCGGPPGAPKCAPIT